MFYHSCGPLNIGCQTVFKASDTMSNHRALRQLAGYKSKSFKGNTQIQLLTDIFIVVLLLFLQICRLSKQLF